jgi:hypothetical protein
MGDGQFCFAPEAVQILMHLIAKIRGRMIEAGLIAAVLSPQSDQNIKARIEGIGFAARMAFDGKVAGDIVNHNSHWI